MYAKRGRKRGTAARGVRWAAALGAAVILAALPACGSALKTPTPHGIRFAGVAARASLVYVQVNWRGWVVLDHSVDISGSEYQPKGIYGPFKAVTACSGFIASPAGDVVTAGHCVDAESYYGGKSAILAAMASIWHHADGSHFTPGEQARLIAILAGYADVEGAEAGTPVDRTVRVSMVTGPSDLRVANVVDVQPFKQGDVALLRVQGLSGPMLSVAQGSPQVGDSVLAAGYQGSVAEMVDSGTPAAYMEGTVSGAQTVNGVPFTQISAELSPGMSGGPVLNMAGQVVGTASWAPPGTPSANFITDTGSIRSILAGNGVSTKLTPADRAFRQGMAYYYASRYHEAVQQFNRTLQAQPGQQLATKYREQAIARYAQDVNPPNQGLPIWVYVAIGAGVVILGGAAGFFLVRRRRAGPSGGPPAQPMPGPVTPPYARPEEPGMPPYARPEGPGSGTAPAGPVPTGQVPSTPPPVPSAPQPPAPVAQVTEEKHVFCPNCGTRHPAEAHYCEHCGQPFPAGMPTEHGSDSGARA